MKNNLKKFVWKVASFTAFPLAAKIAWREIRHDFKDSLVFVNFNAIGDTLYGMSYLAEIKKKYPTKKIVVIVFEKFRMLAETFQNYDEIKFIPNSGFRWFCYKSLIANIGNAKKLWENGIIVTPWGFMENKQDAHADFLTTICSSFHLPGGVYNITTFIQQKSYPFRTLISDGTGS